MKRLTAMLLAIVMVLGLCTGIVVASGIDKLMYETPTNARWGEGNEMQWDSPYLTTPPNDGYYKGFVVEVRYTAADPAEATDADWEHHYFEANRFFRSLRDSGVSEEAWYSFRVMAFGEGMGADELWYNYISEWSAWSDPIWVEPAEEKLPSPTDLKWNGSRMVWNMADVSDVRHFEIQLYRAAQEGSGNDEYVTYTLWMPTQGQTSYSMDITENGLMTETWLVEAGKQDYYFKVRALTADVMVAQDSDFAVCTTRMTVDPAAGKLPTPTDLCWNGNTPSWEFVDGAVYEMQMHYRGNRSPDELDLIAKEMGYENFAAMSPEMQACYGNRTMDWSVETVESPEDIPALNNRYLQNGDGYYWYTVRPVSTDLSRYWSGEWSEESEMKSMDGPLTLKTSDSLGYYDGEFSWNWEGPSAQRPLVAGYDLQVRYYTDSDSEWKTLGTTYHSEENSCTDWTRDASEDGYYSFRVQTITENWEEYKDSAWSEWSEAYWYDAPDRLPTPSNLYWRHQTSTVGWNFAQYENLENFHLDLYYYGPNGEDESRFVWGGSTDRASQYTFNSAPFDKYGNGVYKFHVRALSDNTDVAGHSEWSAYSDAFHYTKPDQSLSAPTGLRWEGNKMVWDIPEDTTGIKGYKVHYYGNKDVGWSVEGKVGDPFPDLTNWDAEFLGGDVTFEVSTLSANAVLYNDSPMAVCSTCYEPPAGPVAPYGPAWNGDNDMVWSWDGDGDVLRHFQVTLYGSEAQNGEKVPLGTMNTGNPDMILYMRDWLEVACFDAGYYCFTVKAMDTNGIWSAESEKSAVLYYEMPDALPVPTNLRWNGSMPRWDYPENMEEHVGDFMVTLYYGDEQVTWDYTGSHSVHFPSDAFESKREGNFTFTVKAEPWDTSRWSSSEEVKSGAYTYTEPKTDLAAPANVRWEGGTIMWDVPTGDAAKDIVCYRVELYNEGKQRVATRDMDVGSFYTIQERDINRLGNTVYARVRALSGDAGSHGDSNWTEASEPFVFTGPIALSTPVVTYDKNLGILQWSYIDAARSYQVTILCAPSDGGEAEVVYSGTKGSWESSMRFLPDVSGTYTFRVVAKGDGGFCGDSQAGTDTVDLTAGGKLGIATELTWGRIYDGSSTTGSGVTVHEWSDVIGGISWKRGLDLGFYWVTFYKVVEGGEDLEVGSMGAGCGSDNPNLYTSEWEFVSMSYNPDREFPLLDSGDYYFTVQARGEGKYQDGDVAVSPIFTYTKPEAQLEPITGLKWNAGGIMTWDVPANAERYLGYETYIYYAETPDGERERVGGTSARDFHTQDQLWDWMIEAYGEGCYWFSIRGLSADINRWKNSEVSPLCGPYELGNVSQQVNQGLSGLLDGLKGGSGDSEGGEGEGGSTPETVPASTVAQAIQDQVNESGLTMRDLANSMTADDGAQGGTLELITKLEELTGVTTTVSVAEEIEETFDMTAVSVVGAGLNAGSGEEVTLSIGKADKGVVIPTQYNNTVQFSMHLEDGEDADPDTLGQQLAIPVSITLPVPTGINPAFLVVLHYLESEDRYEEIHPYIYRENGSWYASFAVTSFSDFALATVSLQTEAAEEGVLVTLNLVMDLPGTAICAVYDGNGKLLGAAPVEEALTAGEHYVGIECDGTKAASVKLFLLDGNGVPAFMEFPCTIE